MLKRGKPMIKQYNITDYIKDDPELQKAVIEEFLNDIKRLQAENERLKEENSKIVWDEVCTTNCSKYKAYNKYRKALEETREIMKRNEWIYQDLLPTHIYKNTMQIQTKINEVLDERN